MMLHPVDEKGTAPPVVSPAARVGIGGPVGSGKTALIEALIPVLQRRGVDLAVVTNDLVTREDAERLRRSGLIDPARVSAVEAGACPHTVIREDPTLNIAAGDDIPRKRGPGLLRCDLLVVNKIDLAPYVGVELAPMLAEAGRVRAGRPVIATNARSGVGIETVADAILAAVLFKV